MPGLAKTDDEGDEAMMLRYARGDVLAFDALYGRHAVRVWRYLLRHVHDTAVADDLLQDVWFAVARQAEQYQPRARFTTWLFTMAHNRMVDHFRTRKNHQSLDDAEAGHCNVQPVVQGLEADSQFGPPQLLQGRQQASALLEAIAQLPAVQRDAFLLQAEADMSVQDIAQATGVSFETAKSRLRYARQALRNLLKEFA